MGLFKPFWKRKIIHYGKETDRMRQSIDEVKSEAKLLEIVRTAPHSSAVAYAASKLTDQSVLVALYRNHTCGLVRCVAIPKISDQSVVAEAANSDRDRDVRMKAVEKLTDQSALVEVAKNDAELYIRLAAIKKLKDKSFLVDVAKNVVIEDVRRLAATKLHRIIGEALSELTDRTILEVIAQWSPDPLERRKARMRLNALKEDKKENCERHQWVYYDCCVMECSVCRALEWNHSYEVTSHSDNGFVERADFRCRLCGHVANHYADIHPDSESDTRQYGSVN